jgi:hypothetical protein
LQFDFYGTKISGLRPAEAEAPPKTWREVLGRVHTHLMVIVDGLFGLPAATFTSACALVRGMGEIPAALADRIRTPRPVNIREEVAANVRDVLESILLAQDEGISLDLSNISRQPVGQRKELNAPPDQPSK